MSLEELPEFRDFARRKYMAELAKLELDIIRLGLEVKNLEAPVKRQPAIWLAIIGTFLAITSAVTQHSITSFKREQLKLEEAQLVFDNRQLSEERDQLQREAAQLQLQREAVEPIAENLAKILNAKELSVQDLQRALQETVGDRLFPITCDLEGPFKLSGMSINKVHVSVDKNGKGRVILAAGGVSHPVSSPPFVVEILRSDAKTPAQEISVPPFPTVRSFHRGGPQFSVDEVYDFDLTPEAKKDLLFESQIRIKFLP